MGLTNAYKNVKVQFWNNDDIGSQFLAVHHTCVEKGRSQCVFKEKLSSFFRWALGFALSPPRESQITALWPLFSQTCWRRTPGLQAHLASISCHWGVSPALSRLYRDVYTEFCFSPTGTNSWRVCYPTKDKQNQTSLSPQSDWIILNSYLKRSLPLP